MFQYFLFDEVRLNEKMSCHSILFSFARQNFFKNFFGANLKLDQIRKFLFWKETYLILLFVTHFLLITRNTIKRDISIVVPNKQKKTFFIVGRKN